MFFKKSHPKQFFDPFLKTFLYSMDQPRVDIIKNVLHSDSLYFFPSRKSFSILIQQIFLYSSRFCYIVFLIQKYFYISHQRIGAFCLFLHQKLSCTSHVLLFEHFFCFYFIIVICHFYIQKKIFENIFYLFFYML